MNLVSEAINIQQTNAVLSASLPTRNEVTWCSKIAEDHCPRGSFHKKTFLVFTMSELNHIKLGQ